MIWKYLSPLAIFICVFLAMELLPRDTNIFLRLGLFVSVITVYICSFNNGVRIGEKNYCGRCKDTKNLMTICSKCLCKTVDYAQKIERKIYDQERIDEHENNTKS